MTSPMARLMAAVRRGERAVTFYYWPKREEGDPPPKKFLTVYRLTGSNRNARSKLADRFTLYTDSNATYCAVLDDGVWDCGLDQESIAQRFLRVSGMDREELETFYPGCRFLDGPEEGETALITAPATQGELDAAGQAAQAAGGTILSRITLLEDNR